MKKIILSVALIAAVAAAGYLAVTSAFFSDTEISHGNIFTAGSLDLQVDHTWSMYNGEECVSQCEEVGENLIVNGGFEEPALAYRHWQVFSDESQTHWVVEDGAGLEIQNGGVAGNPHGGNQLAELDSHGTGSSSTISQTITTVPGHHYRLVFYYSPRPHRPVGDNTIGMQLEVVGDSTVILSDTIGANAAGGSNTNWTRYEYNFIATSDQTKLVFADQGIENTLGGYLDDISVRSLECQSTYGSGGTCMLWNTRNLEPGDTFWNFEDVKPGDYGTDVISLHLSDNPGWICLNFANQQDFENNCNEPESEVPDTTCGPEEGELSQYLQIFTWADDGDGYYEPDNGERAFTSQPVSLADYVSSGYDSVFGSPVDPNDGLQYMGIAWCAGTMNVDNTNGEISCDPAGMGNITQTDSLTTDVVLYAEQFRHNENFVCSGTNNGGGSLISCDDNNLCTDDYYDPAYDGCRHTPINCDDGDPATVDSCDPTVGECQHTAISCDDYDPCTINDHYDATGTCVSEPKCDDNQICMPDTGECVDIDCDDNNLCTDDYYDSAYGSCQHDQISCDDGDPYTVDSCDPTVGCVYTPMSCDDYDPCTINDHYDATGTCVSEPKTCDPGYTCDPQTGDCILDI